MLRKREQQATGEPNTANPYEAEVMTAAVNYKTAAASPLRSFLPCVCSVPRGSGSFAAAAPANNRTDEEAAGTRAASAALEPAASEAVGLTKASVLEQ